MIARLAAAVLCLGAVLAASTAAAPAQAQANDPTPLQFTDTAQETRFRALAAELRCVMCQNQSLADSDAQIAHDLRREVLGLMNQGKSNPQIKQFLVERYGEFVLYRPAVSGGTWLLWFGPLVLLLAGAWVIYWLPRRAGSPTPIDSDEGQEW